MTIEERILALAKRGRATLVVSSSSLWFRLTVIGRNDCVVGKAATLEGALEAAEQEASRHDRTSTTTSER